eukprot:TRINITY_DN18057_c0_g1_i4.p2 TRINITY_DN18057_c0_g1~~TRINITY_DN18057_c0_g1_i4.p2  ORF type:complete len:134 (-),score=4.17 TRINITY_DN18057_c0_g1_i4:249-650(-)
MAFSISSFGGIFCQSLRHCTGALLPEGGPGRRRRASRSSWSLTPDISSARMALPGTDAKSRSSRDLLPLLSSREKEEPQFALVRRLCSPVDVEVPCDEAGDAARRLLQQPAPVLEVPLAEGPWPSVDDAQGEE